MAVWSIIYLREVARSERIDAEHFRPDYVRNEALVNKFPSRPLREVALSIARGTQPQYEEDGEFPVLRTVNVQNGYISETRQEFVDAEFWAKNARGQVMQNDVLITSTGVGTLGRVTYNPHSTPYFADGHITIVRDVREHNPQFIALFLQTKIGLSLIERRYRGSSGQIEIYPDDIGDIPIPQLGEKAEAEIVELCEQSQHQRALSEQLYLEAETLLLSALGLDDLDVTTALGYEANFAEAAVAGRYDADYFQPKYRRVREALAKLPGVRVVPLKEALMELTNGQTPLRHDLSIGEVLFLTAEHVADFQLDFATEKRVLAEHHNKVLKRTQLRPNDVLITIKGRVGNVAVVDNFSSQANINQDVALMRPKADVPPYFLAGFLNSLAGKLLTEQLSTGQINPFLGLGNLEMVPIPLLEPSEMQRLSNLVENKVKEAHAARDDAQNLLEGAKARVEELIEGGA